MERDKFLRGLPNDVRWFVGMWEASSPKGLTTALKTALATRDMSELQPFRVHRIDL